MSYIFSIQLPVKLLNRSIFRSNSFYPACLRRVEVKLILNLVTRASSYANDWNFRPIEGDHLRSILRSRSKYHFGTFDLQLEQHPEKFNIFDRELHSEFQNRILKLRQRVLAAETNTSETNGDDSFMLSLDSSLPPTEALAKCTNSDALSVLALCVNVLKDCKELNASMYHNIYNVLFSEIDTAFEKKIEAFDLNDAILMADAWVLLKKPWERKSVTNILNMLLKHLDVMYGSQVVYTVYLLGQTRKMASLPENYYNKIQTTVYNEAEGLSLDEMAVVASGFHISDKGITHKLLRETILNKFLSQCDTATPEVVNEICQIAHNSYVKSNFSVISKIQNKLTPELYKFPAKTIANLMKLGYKADVHDEDFLAECIKIIKPMLDTCHIVDLKYITYALNIFTYEDEELTSKMAKVLKAQHDDWERYFTHILSCCHHFVLKGLIDIDLIKFVLEPKNFPKTLKNRTITLNLAKKLAWVDSAAEIEIPDYDGPRLTAQDREKCGIGEGFNKRGAYNKLLSILRTRYGADNVNRKVLLPHHPIECIVVGFDHNKKLISAPREWATIHKFDSCTYAPDNNNIWVALMFAPTYGSSVSNRRFHGNSLAAARQLTKMGYHVILIPNILWDIHFYGDDNIRFVKGLMDDKLKEAFQGSNTYLKETALR